MKPKFIPFFSGRGPLTKEAHARSLRYSLIIRFWKALLPTAAFSGFIGLFTWPYLEEKMTTSHMTPSLQRPMPDIMLTNKLLNPRLSTIDAKGRPITLQAESAIHVSDQRADMIKPESRIYLDHGQHVQVRSEKGHYDQLSQRFEYQGHVELQGQDGTKLETSVASINFKTNQAEGKAPVSGRGPTGTLKGEGFKILNEGKEIHLLGKSKLTIQPNDYQ